MKEKRYFADVIDDWDAKFIKWQKENKVLATISLMILLVVILGIIAIICSVFYNIYMSNYADFNHLEEMNVIKAQVLLASIRNGVAIIFFPFCIIFLIIYFAYLISTYKKLMDNDKDDSSDIDDSDCT